MDLEFYGFDGGVACDVVETLTRSQSTDLERVEVLGRAQRQRRPRSRRSGIGGGVADWQRTDWRCEQTAGADWAGVEGEEQTAWSDGHSGARDDGEGEAEGTFGQDRRSNIFSVDHPII